jgi:hypothetical protein
MAKLPTALVVSTGAKTRLAIIFAILLAIRAGLLFATIAMQSHQGLTADEGGGLRSQ